jgi:hypothetical protein
MTPKSPKDQKVTVELDLTQKVSIELDLTQKEQELLRKLSFLRVTKRAVGLLESPEPPDHEDPDAPWVAQELELIGPLIEKIRFALVEAIYKDKA